VKTENKKQKEQKADPPPVGARRTQLARSRYMQEKQKIAKNIARLVLRRPKIFRNLISGEAAAVTREFDFRCVNRP